MAYRSHMTSSEVRNLETIMHRATIVCFLYCLDVTQQNFHLQAKLEYHPLKICSGVKDGPKLAVLYNNKNQRLIIVNGRCLGFDCKVSHTRKLTRGAVFSLSVSLLALLFGFGYTNVAVLCIVPLLYLADRTSMAAQLVA